MTCAVSEDGTITFRDAHGNDIPEHLVEVAKRQNKEAILALIQRQCDQINAQVEALVRVHLETPDCLADRSFVAPPFSEDRPAPPKPRIPGFLDNIFRGRMQRLANANAADEAAHHEALVAWQRRKSAFEADSNERKHFFEVRILREVDAMEELLGANLQAIDWPRETTVSFGIFSAGGCVALDVDLPEFEQMPNKVASVPSRGLKLSVKDMPATKLQRMYADHAHGIIFRLVGEAFAALPRAQQVVASGYSQRPDRATGVVRDEYLLSVSVQRFEWESIDFSALESIELAQALERFDLRRSMLKSGHLNAVEPHQAPGI
jgi:hypothetical protein